MVECLLSRPATGKTRYCVERIQNHLRQEKFSQVWAITPGSYQARAFRKDLAAGQPVLGVRVGTFLDFSKSIHELNLLSGQQAPASLQAAIIAGILERRRQAAPLQAFGPIEAFPGFVKVLRETFSELQTELVDAERMMLEASTAEEKGLASLYEEYQTLLLQAGLDTPAGFMKRAAEMMGEKRAKLSKRDLVVVDGFDDFTKVELAVLTGMVNSGAQILISLPGEEGSSRAAHKKGLATLEKLRKRFPVKLIGLEELPHLPPYLRRIEMELFERAAESKEDNPDIKFVPYLLECRSQEAEVREALRWIKERVVRDGIPLEECAIFASDDTLYEAQVNSIAEEFRLPIYHYHRSGLTSIPAGAALIALLQLTATDYDTKALLATLASPYFEVGLDRFDISTLEHLSRFGRIQRGRRPWKDAWEFLAQCYATDFPSWLRRDDRQKLPPQDEMERIRQNLDGFFNLFPNPEVERPSFQWAEWLDETLDKLAFYQQAGRREGEQIRSALKDSYRTIKLGERFFGERAITLSQFADELGASLSESKLEDPNQTNKDALFYGSFIEARAARYSAVCLIGMAEGLFPIREREDPFLSEDFRARLGMETRLKSDQPGIFYQAITRANLDLLITRPYLTEKGEEKRSSPYWENTRICLPKAEIRRLNGEYKPEIGQLASIEEAAFHYPGSVTAEMGGEDIKHGAMIVNARKKNAGFSHYDGFVSEPALDLTTRFGPEQIWSPTALESFGNCPFTFFTSRILNLKETEEVEEELGPNHIGTIFHTIFERLFRENPEEKEYHSLIQAARQIAIEEFATAPIRFNFRPNNLWKVRQGELLETLEKTLKALSAETEGWKPFEQEYAFGMGTVPSVGLTCAVGELRFRGIIDRVDKNLNGELWVLDYKLSGRYSMKDFLEGRVLQFMIYAQVVEKLFNSPVVFSGYWGINPAKFATPKWKGKKEDKEVQELLTILDSHLTKFLSDSRAGNFPPSPSKGECSQYCPALAWCWRANPERRFH